jgi:hypothetical protein
MFDTIEKVLASRPWTKATDWIKHANGGGFVQITAKVVIKAYVALGALVCDTARVYGSALVENSFDIFIGFFHPWECTVTAEYIAIGCQRHAHAHWIKNGNKIAMEYDCSAEFKAYWPLLKAAVKMVTDSAKKKAKVKAGKKVA